MRFLAASAIAFYSLVAASLADSVLRGDPVIGIGWKNLIFIYVFAIVAGAITAWREDP